MKKMKQSEKSSRTAQFLMRETLPLRQKWTQEELPVVREILSEFPLLETYINVSPHTYVCKLLILSFPYSHKSMTASFGI